MIEMYNPNPSVPRCPPTMRRIKPSPFRKNLRRENMAGKNL
jgi:hypothetical protein